MKIINKIFRNPASDILFMVGLVIACVILINISDLASRISIEDKNTKIYKHVYSCVIDNSFNEEWARYALDYFDSFKQGNVYLTHNVHIDEQRDGTYVYVLMEANEELLFDLKEGECDDYKKYEDAVIIGESLEKFVVEENGKKCIYIDNLSYNVIGILKNNMAGQVDTSLYVFWDTMNHDRKEHWIKFNFSGHRIYYESNIDEICFEQGFTEKRVEYKVSFSQIRNKKKISDEQNEIYKETNKVLLGVGLVFSILTCFSVSHLWLMNRRKELAVRFAYGYNDSNIFILLAKDTFYLVIPSFVISIIVQMLYGLLAGIGSLFTGEFLLKISVVFGGIGIIVLINTLYLMRKMRQFKAVMLSEEK